jgi:DNA-binding response OmpR family regulator
MESWVRGLGYATRVTDEGRETVAWATGKPRAVSFLDRDLERVDGEEVWRVVRRVVGREGVGHRLVLMAERRTKELWFEALAAGIGSLLPLPTEREVVVAALRAACGRDRPSTA